MRPALLLFGCITIAFATPAEWPQWRGPFNTGMARG
jgi:hypothetical protein